MKSLFAGAAFLLSATAIRAQDCKANLYMTNNAKIQMTVYDKKGKQTGTQTWRISDVKKTGSGYQSSISSSFTDEKGKTLTNATGVYKCNGGVLSADVKMFMPQEQTQQFNAADASLDPVYIDYPVNLSAGQALKDVSFTMDVDMKSGMKAKVSFKEEGRKVQAKESVSSSAGTWDAYVITYDCSMKIQLGPLGVPNNYSVKEWYVPGTGIVKSETSRKGKLIGSSLITAISK